MKNELGGQIMKVFVGSGTKTYSYLKDNNDEDRKARSTKNYKKFLEAIQIENKINHLEKKIDVDSLKEYQDNNKLILKTQQRFTSEKHNILTKEINKIT